MKTAQKIWHVHLATPNVKGEFVFEVLADREIGAASAALQQYPCCYIVYTSEKRND